MAKKQEEFKTTDSEWELGLYNKQGYLNRQLVLTIIEILSVIVLPFLMLIIGEIQYFLDDANNYLLSDFTEDIFYLDYHMFKLKAVYHWYLASFTSMNFSGELLFNFTFSLLIILTIGFKFFVWIREKAKIQSNLSSLGLSSYYLKKWDKEEGKAVFKLIKGQLSNYPIFEKKREDILEFFNVKDIDISRKADLVYIKFIKTLDFTFPELTDTKVLSVHDYIKKGSIFMGVGIPMKNEQYNKDDLIENKFIPRYIHFKDLAVGSANLGSAGGGKSVSMAQYQLSFFNNFEIISKYVMVDFKGGIESEPLAKMERRLKTGKIEVFDDNRLGLYKLLKRLDFINKARMKYLKHNGLKKFDNELIVVIFDELAEILDYTGKSKEEKKMQDEISAILESVLRTGRSQNFKIIYSTQSYLATSSGLSSGMKNNTKLKIAHQLGSRMQVGSIKPVEELDDLKIDPTSYDIGRNVVINEQTNEIFEVRSLYLDEDFMDNVEIETVEVEKVDMRKYYKEQYEVQKEIEETLSKNDTKEIVIYALEDIYEDILKEENYTKHTAEIKKSEIIEEKEEIKKEEKIQITKENIVKKPVENIEEIVKDNYECLENKFDLFDKL